MDNAASVGSIKLPGNQADIQTEVKPVQTPEVAKLTENVDEIGLHAIQENASIFSRFKAAIGSLTSYTANLVTGNHSKEMTKTEGIAQPLIKGNSVEREMLLKRFPPLEKDKQVDIPETKLEEPEEEVFFDIPDPEEEVFFDIPDDNTDFLLNDIEGSDDEIPDDAFEEIEDVNSFDEQLRQDLEESLKDNFSDNQEVVNERKQVNENPHVLIGDENIPNGILNDQAINKPKDIEATKFVQDLQTELNSKNNPDVSAQNLLADTFKKLKENPLFENADVNIKSNLNKNDKGYVIETYVNDKINPPETCYKMQVSYTLSVKDKNDQLHTLTLSRTIFTNQSTKSPPDKALMAASKYKQLVVEMVKASGSKSFQINNFPEDPAKRLSFLSNKVFTFTFKINPKTNISSVTDIKARGNKNIEDVKLNLTNAKTYERQILTSKKNQDQNVNSKLVYHSKEEFLKTSSYTIDNHHFFENLMNTQQTLDQVEVLKESLKEKQTDLKQFERDMLERKWIFLQKPTAYLEGVKEILNSETVGMNEEEIEQIKLDQIKYKELLIKNQKINSELNVITSQLEAIKNGVRNRLKNANLNTDEKHDLKAVAKELKTSSIRSLKNQQKKHAKKLNQIETLLFSKTTTSADIKNANMHVEDIPLRHNFEPELSVTDLSADLIEEEKKLNELLTDSPQESEKVNFNLQGDDIDKEFDNLLNEIADFNIDSNPIQNEKEEDIVIIDG